MAKVIRVDRRLRTAAVFVLLALILEIVSLLWTSPYAFFLFIIGTGLLMLIGIVLFLYTFVVHSELPAGESDEEDSIADATRDRAASD